MEDSKKIGIKRISKGIQKIKRNNERIDARLNSDPVISSNKYFAGVYTDPETEETETVYISIAEFENKVVFYCNASQFIEEVELWKDGTNPNKINFGSGANFLPGISASHGALLFEMIFKHVREVAQRLEL